MVGESDLRRARERESVASASTERERGVSSAVSSARARVRVGGTSKRTERLYRAASTETGRQTSPKLVVLYTVKLTVRRPNKFRKLSCGRSARGRPVGRSLDARASARHRAVLSGVARRPLHSPTRTSRVDAMASRARILALRLCGEKWCVFPFAPPTPARDRPMRRFAASASRPQHRPPPRPLFDIHRAFHARAVDEVCAERAAEVSRRLAAASAGPERYLPRSVARWGERTARSFVDTFESWGEHPRGSWRERAHRVGAWMLDRIPPRETTLAELPAACTSAEVAYSEDADEDDARRALAELATDGVDAARRAYRRNLALMPITLPLFLTPMSNLPVYWLGWRAWEQWRGARAGGELRRVIQTDDARPAREDASRWVDVARACTRIGGAGEDGTRNGTRNGDEATVCCRIRTDASLPPPPPVLFAPCAALAAAEDPGERAAAAERATRAKGLTELARRYRRFKD